MGDGECVGCRLVRGEAIAPGGVLRREVVEWISGRLGVTPARSGEATPGPNRRVCSERSRAALGLELAFASFRAGLEPLLRDAETSG